ncbi:MAG: hypothetical protein K8I00_05865 [Candidatus Omnitrophica bacterium]|nr:hypothetical protein [Candidatus Omnitrophota bacterium]
MMRTVPRFFSGKNDIFRYQQRLKMTDCPHCHRSGFLIRHGFLKSYDLYKTGQQIIRGYRFFCSNRNRRNGCGKTFSILGAHLLKQFTITTHLLWKLLLLMLNNLSAAAAVRRLPVRLSVSNGYRLFDAFKQAQSRIRGILSRRCKQLHTHQGPSPPHQTIEHLKTAFPKTKDPIAAFQFACQQPFI